MKKKKKNHSKFILQQTDSISRQKLQGFLRRSYIHKALLSLTSEKASGLSSVTISTSQCIRYYYCAHLQFQKERHNSAKQNKKICRGVGVGGNPKVRCNYQETDLRTATIHSSKQMGAKTSPPRNVGLSPCLLNLQEERFIVCLISHMQKGGLRRKKKESQQHLELPAAATNTSTLRFTIGSRNTSSVIQ